MISAAAAAGSGAHVFLLASWKLNDLMDVGAYMPRLNLLNVVIDLRHGFLKVSV